MISHEMRTFLSYLRGEPRVCSMVDVPTVKDEDRKRRTRERERLLKERRSRSNRIKGLLHDQGVRDVQPLKPGFIASLNKIRCSPPAGVSVRSSLSIFLILEVGWWVELPILTSRPPAAS
jgi:hypothetical protein